MICPNCEKETQNELYCEHCGKNFHNINLQSNEKKDPPFNAHLLNWKYYIGVIIFAIIGVLGDKLQAANGIVILTAIIMTVTYKAKFSGRFAMLFFSAIIAGMIFILTVFLTSYFKSFNDNQNEAKIQKFLSSYKNYPIHLNNEIELAAFTSDSPNTMTQHLRFLNYTKEQLTSTHKAGLEQYVKILSYSGFTGICKEKELKELFENGLTVYQRYYDYNNQFLQETFVNEKKCVKYLEE